SERLVTAQSVFGRVEPYVDPVVDDPIDRLPAGRRGGGDELGRPEGRPRSLLSGPGYACRAGEGDEPRRKRAGKRGAAIPRIQELHADGVCQCRSADPGGGRRGCLISQVPRPGFRFLPPAASAILGVVAPKPV